MSDRGEQKPPIGTIRSESNVASPTSISPTGQTSQPSVYGGVQIATTSLSHGRMQNVGRFELPPLSRVTSGSNEPVRQHTGRIAGVSSILNPTDQGATTENWRRKASQLDSPSPSVHSLPSIATATHSSNPVTSFSGQSPALQHGFPVERPPRRILTPRSPSLHRAASLGQINRPYGTISAQQNPFPSSPHSRAYTIEPGLSGAPPLPASPTIDRPTYRYAAPAPTQALRRVSGGASRARALSSSASPSTSYSSYSQAEQMSPAIQHGAAITNSQSASGDPIHGGPHHVNISMSNYGHERQRPIGIPISSSGSQNVYQMMTLETTSGTVQLPVDVQAASRVADEKRRRNAGASARFRQRRKEKEKEASTTIGRLEQQVKELGEDADFYRRERDIFQGILSTIPGCERHLQRPPSPRLRRSSFSSMSGPSGAVHSEAMQAREQSPPSPDGRNVRRRTSLYSQLPPPPPPQAHPSQQLPALSTAFQPPFGASPYGTPLAPQPPPISQSGRPETFAPSIGRGLAPQAHPASNAHPHGPPNVLQPTPQTGPWTPYSSERRLSGPQNRSREQH